MKGERKIREWAKQNDELFGRCDTCKHYGKCSVCDKCYGGSRYAFDVEHYDISKIDKSRCGL